VVSSLSPSPIFSAENDMLTTGLGNLVSRDKYEIVISEYNSKEWAMGCKSHKKYIEACKLFENRINKELNRNDLRNVWWTRDINGGLKYRDILYENSKAEEIGKQEIIEFLKEGGIIWDYKLKL
jgi:hypothetical protein